MWEESKHPRDDDGRFTSKNGTPAEHKRLREKGIISKEEEKELNHKVRSSSIKAETGYTITATKAEIKKYEKQSKIEKQKLSNNIDKVLNGTYKDTHIELTKNTPLVLRTLGIPNKPLLITAKHAYLSINKNGKYDSKHNHYHNLGKELFMNIPELLEQPKLIFQNKDNNGKLIKDNIVIVVDAIDKDNNQVIVPMKIRGDSGNNLYIEPNVIKSIYGKENYQNFINKNVSKDNLLFKDNKKIRNL